MNEDSLIRRENLKLLKLTPKLLSDTVGGRPSYWSDMLNNDTKSFGEKIARKVEAAHGLVRGSLDEPGGAKRDTDAPHGPLTLVAQAASQDEQLRLQLDQLEHVLRMVPQDQQLKATFQAMQVLWGFVDAHLAKTGQALPGPQAPPT